MEEVVTSGHTPPRSRQSVQWPQQQSTQGPTLSSYAECTAARRAPCLEAWPAAVFALAKSHVSQPHRLIYLLKGTLGPRHGQPLSIWIILEKRVTCSPVIDLGTSHSGYFQPACVDSDRKAEPA